MSSLNRATILGNVGKDPVIRYTGDAKPIASFDVATTVRFKQKNGETGEKTEWHRISAFERLAEVIGQYVKKGSRIYIEGPLQTRKYTDKEGNDRYTVQIVAVKVILLDGPRGGTTETADDEAVMADDDIPL